MIPGSNGGGGTHQRACMAYAGTTRQRRLRRISGTVARKASRPVRARRCSAGYVEPISRFLVSICMVESQKEDDVVVVVVEMFLRRVSRKVERSFSGPSGGSDGRCRSAGNTSLPRA